MYLFWPIFWLVIVLIIWYMYEHYEPYTPPPPNNPYVLKAYPCRYCHYSHRDDEECAGPLQPIIPERWILIPKPHQPGQSVWDRSMWTYEYQPPVYGSQRPESEIKGERNPLLGIDWPNPPGVNSEE